MHARKLLAASLLLALPITAHNLDFHNRDARPVPEWLNRSSIYELWLNAFSPGGNLRGAIPGLQHVADLGATIVYLGPIAKYTNNPHGSPYSVADYNAIDAEAGTDQDLRDFVATRRPDRSRILAAAPARLLQPADAEIPCRQFCPLGARLRRRRLPLRCRRRRAGIVLE